MRLREQLRVHLEMQDNPTVSPPGLTGNKVGTWLSLVERTLGVGEVASSNLVVPTIYFQLVSCCRHVSWVHKSLISEARLQTSANLDRHGYPN